MSSLFQVNQWATQITKSALKFDMPMMEYSALCKFSSITQSYYVEGDSNDQCTSSVHLFVS